MRAVRAAYAPEKHLQQPALELLDKRCELSARTCADFEIHVREAIVICHGKILRRLLAAVQAFDPVLIQ